MEHVMEGLTWTGAINRWKDEVSAPDEFWTEMRRMAKAADRWNQSRAKRIADHLEKRHDEIGTA